MLDGMDVRRVMRWVIGALLAALALTHGGPTAAETNCFLIRNLSSNMILGHAENADRQRVTFRLEKGRSGKYCLEGKLYPGRMVYVVLKNFLIIPLFDCKVPIDRPIDVYSVRQGDGYRTFFECPRRR